VAERRFGAFLRSFPLILVSAPLLRRHAVLGRDGERGLERRGGLGLTTLLANPTAVQRQAFTLLGVPSAV